MWACKKANLPVPKGLHIKAECLKELSNSLTSKQRIEDYIRKNKKEIDQLEDTSYSGNDWHKQYEHAEPQRMQEEEEEPKDSRLARQVDQEMEKMMDKYRQDKPRDTPRQVYAVQWDNNSESESELHMEEEVEDLEPLISVPQPPKNNPQSGIRLIKWQLPQLNDVRSTMK